METINYGTSNYITMGVQPEYPWEYEEDSVLMDEMRELAEEWGCSVDEAINQNIQDNLEADIGNVEWYLKTNITSIISILQSSMDTTMDSTST